MKFFNTAGPVNAEKHYLLDPLHRWNLNEIISLIQQEKYFVLHAPRQSGKTSCMLALQKYLNQQAQYYCLYVNVEPAQVARGDVKRGIHTIMQLMTDRLLMTFNLPLLAQIAKEVERESTPESALGSLLKKWCAHLDKPLILLIDEIDSLVDDTLISLLRQLREGYDTRPQFAPSSVILCGVRDVRDYRIFSSSQGSEIKGGSAFNIKAKSLTLGSFTSNEIRQLYLQHTEVTGQIFEDQIWEPLFKYTGGQPWLVNALGYELCSEMAETQNPQITIKLAHVEIAKERLIQRRDTHLDQLIDKLKEDRVRRVIEPLLSGVTEMLEGSEDDILYCKDLGIIDRFTKNITIANQIYKEIIPRTLTHQSQQKIVQETAWYINAQNHQLDFVKLLTAFQEFFRLNIEHWIKDFNYPEAGPQLLLQAFLQRIINGGGRISREYGLGRGRVDLFIEWPIEEDAFVKRGKIQRVLIECKLKTTQNLDSLIAEGLQQTFEYSQNLTDKPEFLEPHLVVFDRSSRNWDEKIWVRHENYQGKTITVWGM